MSVSSDPSGAISFSTIGNIAKIIGDGVKGFDDLFGGDSDSDDGQNQNQRRA